MPSKKKDDKKRKTGLDPETVKIDKPWEEAVGDTLKKKRPREGWPKKSDNKK